MTVEAPIPKLFKYNCPTYMSPCLPTGVTRTREGRDLLQFHSALNNPRYWNTITKELTNLPYTHTIFFFVIYLGSVLVKIINITHKKIQKFAKISVYFQRQDFLRFQHVLQNCEEGVYLISYLKEKKKISDIHVFTFSWVIYCQNCRMRCYTKRCQKAEFPWTFIYVILLPYCNKRT